MSSTLREKLRLSPASSDEEAARVCSHYALLYQRVIDTAGDEAVKALAVKRLQALRDAAAGEGIILPESRTVTPADITDSFLGIEAELASLQGHGNMAETAYNRLKQRLEALPDCAKKHYLMATLEYARNGSSIASMRVISDELTAASNGDSENDVYRILLRKIIKELDDYQNDEIKHHRRNKFKRVMRMIGHGLVVALGWLGRAAVWIVLGILAIIAAIAGAMCESC